MTSKPKVIDLFCGIGGLTHGFVKTGFEVVAGIDNDTDCKYGYEANNGAQFIGKDIADVTSAELKKLFGKGGPKILVGCAPCQPFSKLNRNDITEEELQPLQKFAQLIQEIRPDIVSMENVRGLISSDIFKEFIDVLEQGGYKYSYQIVDFSDYGVPQTRKRLVLLASRLGPISLIPPTHLNRKKTVRGTIANLPPISAGGNPLHRDAYHRARRLSEKNMKRIMATPKNGGDSESWDEELILKCHKKKRGATYRGNVYGRMRWDEPAPTMTTQCLGIGNGRYGHPEQDRAISIREAARIQTFPDSYKFIEANNITFTKLARFIGNAVPVRAGEVIAQSIKRHIATIN